MTAFQFLVLSLVDPFPFVLRLLKGRVSLPGMFSSSCQFIFNSLECIIELAERRFLVFYGSIGLSKLFTEGVPDLGRSA